MFGIDVNRQEDEVASSMASEAAFHACKVVRQAPAVVGIGTPGVAKGEGHDLVSELREMNLLARLIGKSEVRDRFADLDHCRGLPRIESRGNRRKAAGLHGF